MSTSGLIRMCLYRSAWSMSPGWTGITLSCMFLVGACSIAAIAQSSRIQTFDSDPGWTGVNNQPQLPPPVTVSQNFGHVPAARSGETSEGKIGGNVWRAAEPAWYAQQCPSQTFRDKFSASGIFSVTQSHRQSGLLFGWFNASSPGGWRNANSLALRFDGEEGFYRVYCEYGTQLKRTGSTTIDRRTNRKYPADGSAHHWSLSYDPEGNQGGGAIHFSLDDERWTLNLEPGHKSDGAVFNRFGMWNRQTEAGSSLEVYFENLLLNGVRQDLSRDPAWECCNNRRTYADAEIRPRHNFGWRGSNHAGGDAPGEMGGILWRTERAAPETAAYYADTRIGTLSLTNKLSASGRLAMVRTCVDSGVFIGWFDPSTYDAGGTNNILVPKSFLGAVVEGPSAEGQKVNACYCSAAGNCELQGKSPRLLPPTGSLNWSIEYAPSSPGSNLVVCVSGEQSVLTLPAAAGLDRTRFTAFGIGTLRKGGHWIEIFFDDVTYSVGLGVENPK